MGIYNLNKLIIVDKSPQKAASLSDKIQNELNIDVFIAHNFEETKKLLISNSNINAAIIEPDFENDSKATAIDLLLEENIPVIVLTDNIKTDYLDLVINKPIVDYVIGSNKNSINIIINLLSQVLRHQKTSILVIDDSKSTRLLIIAMLEHLNLNILEANGVDDALKIIKENPDIKLLLTDYSMNGRNGIDLTNEIRKQYSNKELSIIGHSAYGNAILSADFIKNGANDFINKPFQKQELINRVLLQLDMIDYIAKIKDSSERDYLTGISNRKYVYEVGRKLFDNAKRGNIELVCSMIDIDHFKKVNDTYGHDIGDQVIIRLAEELSNTFRKSDIIGRIGGEEFCVVLTNPNMQNLENIFDSLRQKIEKISIDSVDQDKNEFTINFTVSIGVTSTLNESFEEMMKFADMKLYEAKNYGRNMVVI